MSCPRPVKCRASCGHRQIVERYYEMRDDQENRADLETRGHEAEFYASEPRITFKSYLEGGVR